MRNLTEHVIQTPEQQKWLTKLVGYDFEINYRAGKNNSAANALSRSTPVQLLTLTTVAYDIVTQLRAANKSHPDLMKLHQQLQRKALIL